MGAVDGPFEGRPAGRRGLDRLPSGLASRVRRAPTERSAEAAAWSAQADRVLRAAVEALVGLARRTPGFDVTVTVNPPDGCAPSHRVPSVVRIRYTDEGLVAQRPGGRDGTAGRREPGPAFDESEVASELASMLWSGKVEPT